MKPSIVFLGNAQASALWSTWCARMPYAHQYATHFVHYLYVSDTDKDKIVNADVIVLQVSDREGYDLSNFNVKAKIITFPYIHGAFLWPYSGHTHPHWSATSMASCSAFAGETGDGFLAQLVNRKISANEAIIRYNELDIVKAARIERRFELEMEMQHLRDQKARFDVDSSEFIRNNLGRINLFISRQRLAKPTMWFLANPIFCKIMRFLGDNDSPVIDAERLDYISLSGVQEMPLHPKLVRHFSLPNRPTDYRYRINYSYRTFNDYTSDYIDEVFQEDIFAGIKLLKNAQYENGIEAIRRGILLAPESLDAAAALSSALAHLGRKDEALEMALIAAEGDKRDRDFLVNLAERHIDLNNSEAAIVALESAIDIHPFYPTSNKLLIDLLIQDGRADQALDLARGLARSLPTVVASHFLLAQILVDRGDLEGAVDEFRFAIRADGRDFGLSLQAAHLLIRLGRHDEAISIIESSDAARAGNADYYVQFGHILWRCGRLLEAEHAFRSASTLAPESEDCNVPLADLLGNQGRVQEAINHLKQFLARSKHGARTIASLGHLFWKNGDLLMAEQAFTEAISLSPQNESLKVFLSHILIQAGDTEKANAIMVAIADDSQSSDTLAHLASLWVRCGDFARAEMSFNAALVIEPSNIRAIDGLREIHATKL